MPVTARLSKLFYERLGEQAASELVDWFNAVDATYRGELRDLNELNFGRFDARVEQRFAESEARTEQRIATVERRLDQRISMVERRLDQRISTLEATMERRFGEVQAQVADLKAELIKWMFLFWAGTALAGMLLRLV